jgi:predicted DNA repair protein MutK
MDDVGLYLHRRASLPALRLLGRGLLSFAPWLLKALSLVGTVAMFLVGGGIIAHGVPWIHSIETHLVAHLSHLGSLGRGVVKAAGNGLVGLLVGLFIWGLAFAKSRVARTKP